MTRRAWAEFFWGASPPFPKGAVPWWADDGAFAVFDANGWVPRPDAFSFWLGATP